MGLLVVSLLPIVFHKRIPKLKNYPSWKARVPLALLYLMVPMTVGGYLSNKVQAEVGMKYQLNMKEFMQYRLTGDVTYINPEIKFYEGL